MASSLTSQPALTDTGRLENRWMSPKVVPESEGGHGGAPGVLGGPGVNVTAFRDAEDKATIDYINYVAYGIIAFIIVGVGIVGNILNLIVLTRPKLKGVMYVYLLGLAVSNLCVLITAIPALMDIIEVIQSETYISVFFRAHLEIPLLNSFMAASVYIIICMTVNRYISIYKPTHFQRIHTFKNAYIAIACSFIGGMILHIPLAFEASVVAKANGSSDNTDFVAEINDDVANHWCFHVYLWISESLLRFGPIITLTILNLLIIVRFHRIAMKREVLKGGHQHRGSYGGLSNPPASPYSTTINGPTSSTMVSSVATTTTSNGNRLSVTQVTYNGGGGASRLSIPGEEVMPDAATSCISRAITPVNGSNGMSPTKGPMISRATPSRVSSKRRGLHNPEERMLVVVLIGIVILFVVCTTPAAVLSILINEDRKKKVWFAIFRGCANNLELLCFALNFFVYCLCSADIRRAFVDVLFENSLVQYLRRKSFSSNGVSIELADVGSVPPQHQV